MPAVIPLLERHRIFHTTDVDEARSYLQGKEFRLDIGSHHASDLDMRINGVYLPGMWLGYFGYGPPVTIRAMGRDDYWLQFPLGGPIEIADASSSIICDTRRAALLSPTRTDFYRVRSSTGCGRLSLSLPQANLVGQLGSLLGESPTVPLQFASTIDLTQGYGRSLARYLRTAVEDLQTARGCGVPGSRSRRAMSGGPSTLSRPVSISRSASPTWSRPPAWPVARSSCISKRSRAFRRCATCATPVSAKYARRCSRPARRPV